MRHPHPNFLKSGTRWNLYSFCTQKPRLSSLRFGTCSLRPSSRDLLQRPRPRRSRPVWDGEVLRLRSNLDPNNDGVNSYIRYLPVPTTVISRGFTLGSKRFSDPHLRTRDSKSLDWTLMVRRLDLFRFRFNHWGGVLFNLGQGPSDDVTRGLFCWMYPSV